MNIRRIASLGFISLLVLLCVGAAAASAAPQGPRLAVVKFKEPERTELLTVGPLGGSPETLLSVSAWKAVQAVFPFSAPSWSPDGTRIAFTTLAEEKGRFVYGSKTGIALIAADGGKVEPIPGTIHGIDPVFSPDGKSIAYARELVVSEPDSTYASSTIWIANLATGATTQLTPWREGTFELPVSFSPDGTRLALSSLAEGRDPRAEEIGLDGSPARVIADDAYEPVYSPDGSEIAFLRGPIKELVRHFPHRGRLLARARMNDIFVINALGGDLRRITHTRLAAEGAPRWDPSGQRLSYSRWRPFGSPSESPFRAEGTAQGFGKGIWEINADGSCATKVFEQPVSEYEAAVWQPGADRGAGPIHC